MLRKLATLASNRIIINNESSLLYDKITPVKPSEEAWKGRKNDGIKQRCNSDIGQVSNYVFIILIHKQQQNMWFK